MLTRSVKKIARITGLALLVVLTALGPATGALAASTTLSFNFEDPTELDTYFSKYVSSGSLVQQSSGGIGDSGVLSIPGTSSTYAIIEPLGNYSVGPAGSSYSFSAYMKSVGNSGYSGFGFTALTPSAANTSSSYVFRPSDAIGISVHGGGFVFHDGATDTDGSWASDNAGITTITKSSNSALLNSGSPDSWYKIVFTITRTETSTFDLRVEVWPVMADGTLINSSAADAIFEMNNQADPGLINASRIYSYINFSGYRVTAFDGFNVNLTGGATVGGVVPGALPEESSQPVTPELAATGSSSAHITTLWVSACGALLLGAAAMSVYRVRKKL